MPTRTEQKLNGQQRRHSNQLQDEEHQTKTQQERLFTHSSFSTTMAMAAMLLSSSSSSSSSLYGSSLQQPKQHHRKPKSSPLSLVCLKIGIEDIAEIAHNKVLVSAVVSCAIGQLTKPFTTSLLYGEKVNFRRIVGAGGFPSTHSASVVAAATSLGLERGFSDSVFGMAFIFAGIVMYDAQAVRREVGIHAKLLNKTLALKTRNKSFLNRNKDILVDSKAGLSTPTKPEALGSVLPNSKTRSTLTLASESDCVLRETYSELVPLQESIGHTPTEVIAGALLGFLVTLSVYTFI